MDILYNLHPHTCISRATCCALKISQFHPRSHFTQQLWTFHRHSMSQRSSKFSIDTDTRESVEFKIKPQLLPQTSVTSFSAGAQNATSLQTSARKRDPPDRKSFFTCRIHRFARASLESRQACASSDLSTTSLSMHVRVKGSYMYGSVYLKQHEGFG